MLDCPAVVAHGLAVLVGDLQFYRGLLATLGAVELDDLVAAPGVVLGPGVAAEPLGQGGVGVPCLAELGSPGCIHEGPRLCADAAGAGEGGGQGLGLQVHHRSLLLWSFVPVAMGDRGLGVRG